MKFEKTHKASSTHVCSGCGSCCRNFVYIRLSQNDIKTLEIFTGQTSEEFTSNIDKAGEKRFMKFQENGDCIFLNMIDGAYSCSVYEARSATCRDYPSTDIQRETCRVNSDR
ncbi:MAG: YkgJ family cysteine cluster protein [Deltaproteobacteria bacterium]|nr:YkgJ family cysteine cluster protein [Deltaproteobacteria bacterium]